MELIIPPGRGYGLKIKAEDRDRFSRNDWENVLLSLEGEKDEVTVNVSKKSFWNNECKELIKQKIGPLVDEEWESPLA